MGIRTRSFLFMLVALLLLQPSGATASSVSLGWVQTELEKEAVRVATRLEALSGVEYQTNGPTTIRYFSPEFDVQTGGEDSFDGFTAKATGAIVKFKQTTVGDVATPDFRGFLTFPFSLGAETDGGFKNVVGLAELGGSYWWQGKVPPLLRRSKLGAFLQGGYKFKTTGDSASVGGRADESLEEQDRAIWRLKVAGEWNPKKSLGDKYSIGLDVGEDWWFDIANEKGYNRFSAKVILGLPDDRSVDFGYQKGSGPPSFNAGDQFGAGLTVEF